jgi:hypothetical protein
MPPDASDRGAWPSRLIDARLSAAETTELERLVELGADRELSLDLLLKARELEQSCRAR